MGINFDFKLAIGFRVTEDELLSPFTTSTEAKWHAEDRFNPKTGIRLQPVVIVDEPSRDIITIDGEEMDDYEAIEHLVEKLECVSWECNDGDESTLILGPDFDSIDEGVDYGNVSFSGGITFDDAMALAPALTALRDKIAKLIGKDPGPAVVVIANSVG